MQYFPIFSDYSLRCHAAFGFLSSLKCNQRHWQVIHCHTEHIYKTIHLCRKRAVCGFWAASQRRKIERLVLKYNLCVAVLLNYVMLKYATRDSSMSVKV